MKAILKFLQNTAINDAEVWDYQSCSNSSDLIMPEFLLGQNKEILRHDINSLWTGWFIDSLVKKEYLHISRAYATIFKDVYTTLKEHHPQGYSSTDIKELASLVSDLVQKRVEYFKVSRKRKGFSEEVREHIESCVIDNPRCWFTGYKFPNKALDRFLNGIKVDSDPLPYYDRDMPIGKSKGDLNVEIDHLYPFSRGGEEDIENFRPICSWANKVKGNRCLLYDTSLVSTSPSETQSFWIIRNIATKRRCDHFGCNKSVDTSRMVAAGAFGGMVNPTSMRIYCTDHDPQSEDRYIYNSLI